MINETKIILDLCSGTGAWSKPYKDAGYDVIEVTLPEYNVIEYIPPENVYGILAAPPCTEFSLARQKNRYMKEKPKSDYISGLSIVDACLRIIIISKPMWWALENPVGKLRKYLKKPVYTFHPWEYGDPWTKRTDIWGTTNKPLTICKTQQECLKYIGIPIKDYLNQRNICPSIRKGKLLPSKADLDLKHFKYCGMREERSAFRAITPSGFAKAFYEANK